MAARSRVSVCGCSLIGTGFQSNLRAWVSVVIVVCCQVEVSASG